MELKGSRGYLLPEVIDPGEYVCFSLYIPAADEYIIALSGALHELATWKVWERDGTTRAAQAAAVWKDALDLSIEELWLDGVVMTCKNVEELIDAIANIKINVSGGGGCCDPLKEFRVPDDWEDGLPESLPPLTSAPTTVPTGDLCDNAHQTHAEIREVIDTFPEMTLNESAGYDQLYAFLEAKASFLLPPAIILFRIMHFIAGGLYELLETDTLAFWDGFKEEFICNILANDNAGDLYAWMKPRILESDASLQVRMWLDTILQMVDWNLLYDDLYDADPDFVGSDCSFCIASANILWDFASMIDLWVVLSRTSYDEVEEAASAHPKDGNPPDPTGIKTQRNLIADKAGVPDSALFLTSMKIKVYESTEFPAWSIGKFARVRITYHDDTTWESNQINTDGVHTIVGFNTNKELRSSAGGAFCIEVLAHSGGSNANGVILFDDIEMGVLFT